LYNSADDYTQGYMQSKAMVKPDGEVFWYSQLKYTRLEQRAILTSLTFFLGHRQRNSAQAAKSTSPSFRLTIK
jgi:hypothetical protein